MTGHSRTSTAVAGKRARWNAWRSRHKTASVLSSPTGYLAGGRNAVGAGRGPRPGAAGPRAARRRCRSRPVSTSKPDLSTESTAGKGSVLNCHGIDCSLYLTRAETQKFNKNINAANGGTAGLVAACGAFVLMSGPAGVITAVACGAGIATYGGVLLNSVSRASADNNCLRVQFRASKVHVPLTHITKLVPISPALAFNDDDSGYCH